MSNLPSIPSSVYLILKPTLPAQDYLKYLIQLHLYPPPSTHSPFRSSKQSIPRVAPFPLSQAESDAREKYGRNKNGTNDSVFDVFP